MGWAIPPTAPSVWPSGVTSASAPISFCKAELFAQLCFTVFQREFVVACLVLALPYYSWHDAFMMSKVFFLTWPVSEFLVDLL
jgi:hypothetical protein